MRTHAVTYQYLCAPHLISETNMWRCSICERQARSPLELNHWGGSVCLKCPAELRPTSRLQFRESCKRLGLVRAYGRGTRVSQHSITERAAKLKEDARLGIINLQPRAPWQCTRCEFTLPTCTKYFINRKKEHMLLHGAPLPREQYVMTDMDQHAARMGRYALRAKQHATYSLAVPSWAHQIAIKITRRIP